MTSTRSRLIAGLGAVAGTALVAATALAVLPPWQTAEVAVPADDAEAGAVVRAYVAALDAHDCATAEALSAPDAVDATARWCGRVAHLDGVDVADAVVEDPAWSGRPATVEVVMVPVTFDLDWRLGHGDVSMPEGRTVWGYVLVREDPADPWRIADQGVG
ncbi:DUF4829 domain-containing protein [Demequina iriomotensis]|uniref:DUF4829 domain-containing protein n=1 Tax=Demequina iriomotensis TaxID=1536641 RepID=UPI0007804C64|nr:hypothetical protein [Demequina iriomotensis]